MVGHAGQYDDFAVISSTMGVNDGRVCVGEGTRGDIGCPTYAPTVAADGSISATRFVGDGSGLFNIAGASADRIVSGSTSMLAISDTGYISVTQSGVNTAYFHPSLGLVTVGVSSTGYVSSTKGYFTSQTTIGNLTAGTNIYSGYMTLGGTGNVSGTIRLVNMSNVVFSINTALKGLTFSHNSTSPGYPFRFYAPSTSVAMSINTSESPSATLHVSGTALTTSWTGINFSSAANVVPTAPLEVSGTVSATRFVGDGSGLTGLASGDRITSGTAGVFVSDTGIINLRTGGVTTGYLDTAGRLVAPGISITTANGISSTSGYFSGAVVNAPQANTGTSIDWSKGNVQSTSASCGPFTFTNMQDGGVYSLTVKGTTAGTCAFSQSGLTFRMPPNHGTVSTGTMTFYTFTRSGSDVMVNWMPGY